MAVPMTANQLLKALEAEGLQVAGAGRWRTHNRNGSGAVSRPWGPLHGVMIHHTATGEDGIVEAVRKGHGALPGPLAHGVIHKSGKITLTGWGRANHAGLGDAAALDAVIRESKHHPKPGRGTVDGNARFVGWECVNLGDGEDPWPEAQLDAMVRASAAVCRRYGWSAQSVIGHKEWTNQKIDPAGIDMSSFRTRVEKVLRAGAGS